MPKSMKFVDTHAHTHTHTHCTVPQLNVPPMGEVAKKTIVAICRKFYDLNWVSYAYSTVLK
jgi:phosphopentomutase